VLRTASGALCFVLKVLFGGLLPRMSLKVLITLGQYRTKGVSPESQEIFVRNKDKSTGIAALFRAFWTPFPRKKIREGGPHDLCGVALVSV